jgi:hypothetical protein
VKIIITPRNTSQSGWILNHFFSSAFFFLLFFQVFMLTGAYAKLNNLSEYEPTAPIPSLPLTYGTVIYRYNENSPKKLYIVGISHRDSCSRLNGDNTAKTQAEVYRIGEWLNQNGKLDLLLPEGFFSTSKTGEDFHLVQQGSPLGGNMLEKKLGDDSHFVNAEMLLIEQLKMRAGQVEDRWLYDAVINRMVELENHGGNPAIIQSLREEIDYLQERRTAAILQKIPTVIENSCRNSNVKSENALFTIGLKHIGTIISYLEKNKIHIQSPPFPSDMKDDYVADLNLLKEGFGIIIIIPNTLVQDQETMTKKLQEFPPLIGDLSPSQ